MHVPACRFKFNSMWPVTAWSWWQGISGARTVKGQGFPRTYRWIPLKTSTLCEPEVGVRGDTMPQLLTWGGGGVHT